MQIGESLMQVKSSTHMCRLRNWIEREVTVRTRRPKFKQMVQRGQLSQNVLNVSCEECANDWTMQINLQTFPVARPNEQRHAIHDQLVFMNGKMRELCYKETAIRPATFVQMKGDAVFIPAGAPHMVRQ